MTDGKDQQYKVLDKTYNNAVKYLKVNTYASMLTPGLNGKDLKDNIILYTENTQITFNEQDSIIYNTECFGLITYSLNDTPRALFL